MATTAIQVDFLLSGSTLVDGTANNAGKVYFFSAGTTTTKAVYSDKAKTAYDVVIAGASDPHTGESYVLLDAGGKPVAEAGGRAEVYADGTYDIVVYDSDAGNGGTPIDTMSSVSYEVVPSAARVGSYHATGPVTMDSDTNAYYFDTTSGNITATFDFDASSVSAGFNNTCMIVAGINDVIITPKAGSTIGGEATWTISGANTATRLESDGTNDDWVIAIVSTHDHSDVENGGNTLTIPTIADFTNATHDHADASGGGTTLTDVDLDSVDSITLDGTAWPSFSVSRGGSVQSIPHNTFTKVVWTTEDFDTNSDFASNEFIPTVAGKYILTASAIISTGVTTGFTMVIRIYKNGSYVTSFQTYKNATGDFQHLVTTAIVDANGIDDDFSVYVRQEQGGALDLSGVVQSTYFQGSRIA